MGKLDWGKAKKLDDAKKKFVRERNLALDKANKEWIGLRKLEKQKASSDRVLEKLKHAELKFGDMKIEFIESIRRYYAKNGFLSAKQIKCTHKIIDELYARNK